MTSDGVSNEVTIIEFAEYETGDDDFFVIRGEFVPKVF